MNRQERRNFIEELRARVKDGKKSAFSYVCSGLKQKENKFNWVGIYVLSGDKLQLDTFEGEKTQHVQIALGDGLCSLAVLKNEIVNEADVKSNSKYLACFPTTRSELVVPVRKNGFAVGEIDIDSDLKNAFDKEDERFVTEIANMLGESFF
ncbi:MAG: GAF domain-containing protein [Candidatus Thermoplasmatota archaeon]|nr:GAF domain-containing protein [Candidatus Thermoplasmatota archaeon]MCL5793828.1 GAF domain-containing protein [Candidatus Thermoplasmatota archaeon]